MTKEIREFIALELGVPIPDVGVIRGDNITIITVARGWQDKMTAQVEADLLTRLRENFDSLYVSFGHLRFVY